MNHAFPFIGHLADIVFTLLSIVEHLIFLMEDHFLSSILLRFEVQLAYVVDYTGEHLLPQRGPFALSIMFHLEGKAG